MSSRPTDDPLEEGDNPAIPEGTDRPSSSIKERKVEIIVQSILYELEEEVPTCTVVLKISFTLGLGEGLASAAVPLGLKVYESYDTLDESSGSMPKEINPKCYLHAHFTGINTEVITREQYLSHRTVNVGPNIKVNVGGSGGEVSGVGWTEEYTREVKKEITLVGQCLKNNMEVKWIFGNKSKEAYPPTVMLMVIVKKTDGSQKRYFPFSLDLGDSFKLSSFGKSWKDNFAMWFRQSQPRPIHITGEWQPKVAADCRSDIARFQNDDGTPQHLGLRAAAKQLYS